MADQAAKIPSGQSLSGIVDLGGIARICGIIMPAAWDAASLTFQVSSNGVDFYNLFDATGTEYGVAAAAGHAIVVSLADGFGFRYLKVRSGTNSAPVAQSADRTLTLEVG